MNLLLNTLNVFNLTNGCTLDGTIIKMPKSQPLNPILTRDITKNKYNRFMNKFKNW